MITGTGIDITLISRMTKKIASDAFMTRVFTEYERGYIGSKGYPAQTAAGIFSAKEAYLKAAGLGILDIPLTEIEVRHKSSGAPYICAEFKGRAHLSVSHTGDIAVAQVIIESED